MHVRSACTSDVSVPEKEPENSCHRFRAHFTRELVRCVREQHPLAESFGLVFTETLDRIPLDEDEQSHLYRELLSWAKQSAELFPAIHRSYSQRKSREIGSVRALF
jgi:DNA-binding transcriptional LysR family regulator